MVIHKDFWKGRKVLITGHTGFKGSWLCLWLNSMGANVYGIGLSPLTEHSIYKYARIADIVDSNISDIRNFNKIKELFDQINPEIVLFLEPYYSNDFMIKIYDIYKSMGEPQLKFLIIKDSIEEKFINKSKIQ